MIKKFLSFGSLDFQNSNLFNLEYNFSVDNKLNNISYHGIDLEFSINNFVTNFNFIEEGGALGTAHILEIKSNINLMKIIFIL